MARLKIRVYPDSVLRGKSTPVESVSKKERQLASDMIDTMRSSNGVGLAAPQVGILKRLIVVEDVEKEGRPALALINPIITEKKGRSTFCEGCLSVPEVTSDVVRPEAVTVEALNLDGEKIRISTDGLLARVIQHEIDHLEGILFIDRIGFLKRRRVLKKLSSKVCVKL